MEAKNWHTFAEATVGERQLTTVARRELAEDGAAITACGSYVSSKEAASPLERRPSAN